ncbi:MAG: VanZ family protein [Gammaproteobacteria bacterium]|nr:VanZ family protein [Gammaproteobacteria bacterium]
MTGLLLLVTRFWLPLSLAQLALITTLSLLPLSQLPEVSGGDKLHHLLAYCALMFPVALRKPAHWVWIGLLFLALSGAIELLQPLVNRYAQWSDLLANGLGLGLGLLVAIVARRYCLPAPQVDQ